MNVFRSNCSTRNCVAVRSFILFLLFFSGFSFPAESLPSRPSENVYSRQNIFVEKFFLNIDNGLITLIARSNPLGPILEEISRRSGEKIIVSPGLRSKKINARWKDLPLEEGLKKIAEESGLLSGRDETGNIYLSEFRDFSKNRGQAVISPKNNNIPVLSKNESLADPLGIHPVDGVSSGEILSQNKDSGNGALLNEMVIRFKPDITEQDITQILADANIKIKKYIAPLKCHILSLPEGMTSYDAMVLFKNKKMLYQAEPDYLITVK